MFAVLRVTSMTLVALLVLALVPLVAEAAPYTRDAGRRTAPGQEGRPDKDRGNNRDSTLNPDDSGDGGQTSDPEPDDGGDVLPPPPPPPPSDENEVRLEVGDNFASVIAQHPAGTAFRIAAGVHVGQRVTPRAGDTYTGEVGTVLTGAVPVALGDVAVAGSAWVIGGQTAEAFRHNGNFHGSTETGFERHAANNDLFADGVRLNHVNSRSAVDTAGEWFFDYAADEIVVGVDPAAVDLTLSTPWHAFASDADNVTIQNLTITRYASYAQHGAILARGDGWTVANVTVSENHGAGITIGPHGTVTGSRIVDNGQIGVTSWYGAGIRVESNEIAGNRTLQYKWGWEGGGTKFKESTGLVFANNWVHDNHGPGVWFDIDTVDSVIVSNRVTDNLIGVMVEISYGAEIADNTIRDNGADGYGDIGAGIWVSNSSDVDIHHNDLGHNRLDLLATHYERGAGAFGRYETTGLNVHANAITISGIKPTGLRVYTGETEYYSAMGNTFQDNDYQLVPGAAQFWWQGDRDPAAWQGLGFDVDGTFGTAEVDSAVRVPYTPVGYGN